MNTDQRDGSLLKAGVLYFLKAAALVVCVFALGKVLPRMHPVFVALSWALLTTLAASGIAYHAVIAKRHKQAKYTESGRLGRLNAGRILRLFVSFIVAAILTAGLLIECPAWGRPEWCLTAVAIVLYGAVFVLIAKWTRREFQPTYRHSVAIRASVLVTCGLLCGVALFIYSQTPLPSYQSAAEAYLAAAQPFEDSPSALMVEVGLISSLSNWFTDYAASQVGQEFPLGFFILRCALFASAIFGITTLLGSCMLRVKDVRQIFAPLSHDNASEAGTPLFKRYLAVACALPLVLVAGFLGADRAMTAMTQSGEHTFAENIVHDQINLAVYVVDGKYLDARAVDDILAKTRSQAEALNQEAQEQLLLAVNAAFDARLMKVDEYLDWYYSLPADYEQLASLVTGTAEKFAAEQFSSRISAEAEDAKLAECIAEYANRATQLKTEYEEAIKACEIQDDIPEWTLTPEPFDALSIQTESIEPVKGLMSAPQRLGVSAAAGLATGFVAKKLVSKVAEKQFFKTVVKRVSTTLASRAVGAGAGGAVGSVGGPLGTIIGGMAGVAAATGVDYVILMADEYFNRDAYKAEIEKAIEEQRQEILEQLQ